MAERKITQDELITLRLSRKLLRQIDKGANELGMSRSDYIRFVLTTYELEKRKPGKKEE